MPLECISAGLFTCIASIYVQDDKYTFNGWAWSQALLTHSSPRLSLNEPRKQLDMGTLLFGTRSCGTTDPKDRVYGLYGMLQKFGLRLSEVDYSKTKSQIYWEFTLTACQQIDSLELLTLVSSINADLSVPSWVPDYSEVFRPGDHVGGPHATRNSTSRFYFSDQGRRLLVRGTIIDVIRAKSDHTAWRPEPTEAVLEDGPLVNLEVGYEQTIRAFRDWHHVLVTYGALDIYEDYDSVLRAFAESLTCGMSRLANIEAGEVDNGPICRWLLLLDENQDRSAELAMAQ